MIAVLASLTLLSVQPRHASKENKTKRCRRTRDRIHTSPSGHTGDLSIILFILSTFSLLLPIVIGGGGGGWQLIFYKS